MIWQSSQYSSSCSNMSDKVHASRPNRSTASLMGVQGHTHLPCPGSWYHVHQDQNHMDQVRIPPSRPHCELICLQGGNILPAGEVHEGALWRRCQGPQEGLLLPALALQLLLQIQVSSKAQQPSGLRLALALSDPGSSPGSVHPCISASTRTFCRMQLIWKAHQPSSCCEPSLVPGHCEQLPVILRISGRCRPACVKGIDIL